MTKPGPVTSEAYGPDYGFGLYIHWPYCSRICPYCDFNVYAAKDRAAGPLVDVIAADIQAHRDRMPTHGALDTVFLGGGTPSLLSPDQVERFLATADDSFGIEARAEVTLEANPNDLLNADLAGLRAAGINRLSIGVQSLRDDALSFLGRDHDAVAAKAALAAALKVFPSVSIDLIYARPGQTQAEWTTELGEALSLGAHHLSLYELTIEQRTAFGKAAERGTLVAMGEDDQADLYELTERITQTAGMPAYEVSNYAVGPAHQSHHNTIYWQSGDWIGVGPGAHGRLTVNGKRYATTATRQPAAYMASVQALKNGWSEAHTLLELDLARELVSMGLRPVSGFDVRRVAAVCDRDVDRDKLDVFVQEGWARLDGHMLSLTAAGRLLADALAVELSP